MNPALVLALLLSASPCKEVSQKIDAAIDAKTPVSDTLASLDQNLAPLAISVRAYLAQEGVSSTDAQMRLKLLVGEHCRTPLQNTEEARANLHALMKNEGIDGLREFDVLDRLSRWFYEWISELFDDVGVQKYATNISRVFFVGVFFLVIAFLAYKLWTRRRVRVETQKKKLEQSVRVRRLRYDEWMQKAEASLGRGDARAALRQAQMALLVRLGESTTALRLDTRTPDEIIEALPKDVAHFARPLLLEFRDAFFAERETLAFAKNWVSRVQSAVDAFTRDAA